MQTSTRTAPALSSKVACGSTSGAGARAGALVGARAHAAAALAVLEFTFPSTARLPLSPRATITPPNATSFEPPLANSDARRV